MMPKPVPYEQIRSEVMAKRKLKPWEIMIARGHEEDEDESSPEPATSPEMTGRAMSAAVDPMMLAEKRAKINTALAPLGELANPETRMKKRGKTSSPGLMNLLMSLMR